MDLRTMFVNARSDMQIQKAFAASRLPIGQYFPIHGIKVVDTKYGKNMLATLATPEGEQKIWLPKSFSKRLNADEVTKLKPEDNWEISYLGYDEAEGYKFMNFDVRQISEQ